MTLPVERLVHLGRVTHVAASPHLDWIAVAVQRLDEPRGLYVSDLFRVPLDASAATRLTHGDHDDHAPCFRRDGGLGFLSTRGDDAEDPKRTQVWLLPVDGGDPRPLTDEPLGVQAFRFARDGDLLATLCRVLPGVPHDRQREVAAERERSGPSALHFTGGPVRYWDHWIEPAAPHVVVFDEEGGERRDLTPDADREHREAAMDVSADGRRVVVTCARLGADRIHDTSLLVLDVDGGRRELGARPGWRHDVPVFDRSGERVACNREARGPSECPRARPIVYDLDSGEGRDAAPGWDRWATPHAFTDDGDALVMTAADGGHVPVFVAALASGEVTRVTSEAAGGTHEHVQLAGDRLVGARSRLTHPPEPFACALQPSAEPTLLAPLSGFTEDEGRALANVHSLTTDGDGVPVQSFLVTPTAADRAPLVVWIHGGPISQWGDGWHWRWNPLVAADAGLAIALPNPRGSTGFGQDFIAGVWGNRWGEECYRDVMAVTEALAGRDDVDGSRVAAMGGSFGGYMSNWIGGQTDRFACLVTHASLFDLSAFHGATDVPGYFALQMQAHPHRDPEAFDRYSPHRFVTRWKTPTLIVHGEKDYRVPIGEGLALFEALQSLEVPSELLVFPDENHWIRKPRNVEVWYRTVLDFVTRHLSP